MAMDADAIKKLRAAAKQGDAKAQCELGLAYARGQGVKLDDAEAVRWFRLSAEQGFAPAQHVLSIACESGLGAEQDDTEAAKQGYANAQLIWVFYIIKGRALSRIMPEQSSGGDYVAA